MDALVQIHLDFFHITLWLGIEGDLLGTNTLAMLDGPLEGLITNIRSLGTSELVDNLSTNPAIVKSLLDELN